MTVIRVSKSQQGLSLVELMIAMLLGVFLTGGLLQLFINTKQTYGTQESLFRLQENGRVAIDLITRDMRMAGFLGCQDAVNILGSKPTVISDTVIPVIPAPAETTIIGGGDTVLNNWSAAACSASNKCIAGTDSITLRHADSCGGTLTANAPASGDIAISTTNSCGINVNDALIISDCGGANIFRATTVNTAKTSIGHEDFLVTYSMNSAELFMYYDHSYYIRTGAGGGPSLWMLDNTKSTGGNNPMELVEGIENMQILYGVDTDAVDTANHGAANYYVTAAAVTDWTKIVSIRISLLVATIENIATQSLLYSYNGATDIPPPADDRKIRRVFNATIAVRNRVP
jgi:type IV pilus assembly protein PilW